MGLTIKRQRERLITVAVLLFALLLDLAWAPPDSYRQMAQGLLGADGVRIELETGPAFRAGERWVVFFDQQGKVGPIRGAIVIADESIEELHLFESHEGISHTAFSDPTLARSLIGQPAKAPVEVDAITGATISSQMLADGINASLIQWRSAVR